MERSPRTESPAPAAKRRTAVKLSPSIKYKIMELKLKALNKPEKYDEFGSVRWMVRLVNHIGDERVTLQDVHRWADKYSWILDENVTEIPGTPVKPPPSSTRRRRSDSEPSSSEVRPRKRASRLTTENIHNIVNDSKEEVKLEPVVEECNQQENSADTSSENEELVDKEDIDNEEAENGSENVDDDQSEASDSEHSESDEEYKPDSDYGHEYDLGYGRVRICAVDFVIRHRR